MDCINLKERFGDRFKVEYEESYFAERSRRTVEDVWLMIIPCRYGHLYPDGPETLAASVDEHPNIAARLKRLKCCRIHQDGDDGELTVLFSLADFDKVAEIMRPHRKRRWTEEQKQQARERLAKYQFSPGVERHLSEHADVVSAGVV
jgi:hypothetical protein